MKQFRHNGTSNWPSILTRIALVLTSVTIIVLFLPRNSSRLLHYSEGQPWTDGALIAPIDFPVFKSEATLKYERDSVRERFQPYFNWTTAWKSSRSRHFMRSSRTAYRD